MSLFSKFTRASSSRQSNPDLQNRMECRIPEVEQNLEKWSIPKVPYKQIYQVSQSIFSKKSEDLIDIVEQTVPLDGSLESKQLISQNTLEFLKNQDYKYIHIGLILVGIKPLTMTGLDTCVLIALRGCRHNRFHDSLLGIAESTLAMGPVYFDCYPNFSVSLKDPNVLETLTLNIHTSGFAMLPRSEPFALIYKITYKAMKTQLSPKALMESEKGYTILFQANKDKTSVIVPKTIHWNQVTLPVTWQVQASPRKPPPSLLSQVLTLEDGTVELQFSESRKTRLQPLDFQLGRRSESSFRTAPTQTPITPSPEVLSHLDLANLRSNPYHPQIPQPLYNQPSENLSDRSPTRSEMDDPASSTNT